MINLIFAGRLTHEKWFDLILEFCDAISWSEREEKIHLHIFGSGEMKVKIKEFPFVTFYWQQPKDKLMKVWETCTYSLMPSRFLETFGLSALDSLSLWVPVIWFKKWWLEQFWEWILGVWNEKDFNNVVFGLLKKMKEEEYDKLSKKCRDIARQYSRENRKVSFEKILGRQVIWSNILMVSDYSGEIWGIESYIHTVSQKIKERNGSTISRISALPWTNNLWRYLLLPLSARNFFVTRRIKKTLSETSYDLVWWHSIQRWIWPYPIQWVWKNSSIKQMITTHDFGLYHPFPSQIHSEDQLLSSFDFSSRMKAGLERFSGRILKQFLRFFPLIFKFLSSKILIAKIKSLDTVLVPSQYMKKYLDSYYPGKVQVFSHAMEIPIE